MNLDFSAITGALMSALGGVFGVFNLSSETGNGLLGFVEFFSMLLSFFTQTVSRIAGLFGG